MTEPSDLTGTDPTNDPTLRQQGQAPGGEHVPEPLSGVRGSDQADDMDPSPGTTSGADGDTAAREQLRKDLGERAPGAGTEGPGPAGDLEQTAALGATDDPEGGSIQEDGSMPAGAQP